MASPDQTNASVSKKRKAVCDEHEAVSGTEKERTRGHRAARIESSRKTWPKYTYDPLSVPTAIRIVELLPGKRQDDLHCRLYETTFDQEPQYEALSYVWGDPADKSRIVCCGGIIEIPTNLHDFLQKIRDPHEKKHLWADSICIKQLDKREVGHQVAQMSKVYSLAQRVIIWLGLEDPFGSFDPSTDMDKLTLCYTERLLERSASMTSSPNVASSDDDDEQHQFWSSLGELSCKPWFSRMWVVQEAGLARSAIVWFGDRALDFDTLLYAVWSIITSRSGFILTYGVSMLTTFHLFPPRGILLDLGTPRNPDFLDVLNLSRPQHASDPRDYVFALLGHPSAHVGGNSVIEPNYEKTNLEIFRELAITLLQNSQDLRILSAVQHGAQNLSNYDWPSWVPTWSRDVNSESIGLLSWNPWQQDAHAGLPRLWQLDDSKKVLQVRGFMFDTITECTEEFKLPKRYKKDENLLKLWPLAAALSLGIKSKTSTHDAIKDVCMASIGGSFHNSEQQDLKNFAAMRLWSSAVSSEQAREGPGTLLPEGLSAAGEAAKQGIATEFGSKGSSMLDKRMFGTEGGLIGSGPAILRPGDTCCILFGGRVPFLLRPTGTAYRLVGETYIRRVMQGEAVVDYMLGDKIHDQMFDII